MNTHTPLSPGEAGATYVAPLSADNPPSVSFPRVLDATMLSDWKKCPHAFFRRHVQGLVKPRVNIHLHFGGVVAKGLETARRGFLRHGDARDAVTDACEAVIQEWGTAFDDFVPTTRTERNKTLANALLALQEYFREWPLDDDELTIHVHDGQPCVEFSAASVIPGSRHPETGEPLLYAGRFDFIGDYNRTTYGNDDKTASVDPRNDSWRNQWRLRGQFSGYCWLAREYGVNIDGFFVRGMGILTDSVRCGQAIIARPPWMVDAWLRQMQDDVAQMVTQYQILTTNISSLTRPRLGHAFPQSFADACADFGGCSFLDLCTAERPDTWLSEYIERRWNPLTREEA